MLGSLLIFAREGIEGTLICAILLTFLSAAGRRDLFRWVLGGAAAAVALAAVVGVVLWVVSRDAFVGSNSQLWFETSIFLVAVSVLTYMTFWMRRHARTISKELRARAQGAVQGGSGLALALIAFVTVGREAIETVIFLLAIVYQSSPWQLGLGALLGLAIALAAAVAMYRMGRRINIARLFTVVGSLLMVVAAGLLANAVQNLQHLGVLPGADMTLWNIGSVLPDSSPLGDVLHGLFGYTAAPTLLQAVVWVVFVGAGLILFLRPQKPVSRPLAPAAS